MAGSRGGLGSVNVGHIPIIFEPAADHRRVCVSNSLNSGLLQYLQDLQGTRKYYNEDY